MLGKTCEKNDEFALLSLSLKWGGGSENVNSKIRRTNESD